MATMAARFGIILKHRGDLAKDKISHTGRLEGVELAGWDVQYILYTGSGLLTMHINVANMDLLTNNSTLCDALFFWSNLFHPYNLPHVKAGRSDARISFWCTKILQLASGAIHDLFLELFYFSGLTVLVSETMGLLGTEMVPSMYKYSSTVALLIMPC